MAKADSTVKIQFDRMSLELLKKLNANLEAMNVSLKILAKAGVDSQKTFDALKVIAMKELEFEEVAMAEELEVYEETLHKVYAGMKKAGISPNQAESAINNMQNEGIFFREAKREEDSSNPYCMRCGDLRGGPMGHETNECTWGRNE